MALTLIGTIAAITDAVAASLVSGSTATRDAVDARVRAIARAIVGEELANNTAVVNAVVAALQANPDLLQGMAYWKGSSTLTTSTDLAALEAGVYTVWANATATALGLPGNTQGVLEVAKWSSVSRVMTWKPRFIDGSKPQLWQNHWGSSGWVGWTRMDAADFPPDWYQGSKNLTTHVDDSDLPSGVYTLWSGAQATAMGLPVAALGVYERFRWSSIGYVDRFTTAGVQDGTQIWQRHRLAGVQQSWTRMDAVQKASSRVALWGSSTPAGLVIDLGATLAPYDIAVFSQAAGGEYMSQTWVRTGAQAVSFTATGGSIPASGSVAVTASQLDGGTTNIRPTRGWMGGVYGTLSGDETRYLFTRAFPGSAVSTSGGASWVPEVREPAHLNILAAGKNTLQQGATTAVRNKTIAERDAIITYWKSLGQEFLILGHFTNAGQTSSHAGKQALEADNANALATYPDNYLSMQDLLASSEVWQFTGITPTAEDTTEQGLRNLPPSLTGVGNHMNKAGNEYVSYKIREWLTARGLIGKGRTLASSVQGAAAITAFNAAIA